jgi:pimeloyl-ACP methyl ester carboxylesterase
MPHADLGEVTLFHTDDGPREGAPVLLLVHGMAADSHDWIWHIPALAERYRVIAPDLRGHGYSSVPDSGYKPRVMARDLAALLDHLGVDRVTAVGHSLGGQIVSALAVEHPERVNAVVTVDAGYGLRPEIGAFMPGMADALRGPGGHDTALAMEATLYTPATPLFLRQWHHRKILGTPIEVVAQVFSALFVDDDQFGLRPQSEAYLSRRTQPVLALWADPERAEWERNVLKAEVHVFPGNGHRLHEERPQEFVHVLQTWLREVLP